MSPTSRTRGRLDLPRKQGMQDPFPSSVAGDCRRHKSLLQQQSTPAIHPSLLATTSMSSLPLSTSEVSQEVQVRMGKTGLASEKPMTVLQNFDAVVAKHGDKPALYQKRPAVGQKASDVQWTMYTWKDYRAKVDAFGKSLLSVGLQRFDIINIIGFNSPGTSRVLRGVIQSPLDTLLTVTTHVSFTQSGSLPTSEPWRRVESVLESTPPTMRKPVSTLVNTARLRSLSVMASSSSRSSTG